MFATLGIVKPYRFDLLTCEGSIQEGGILTFFMSCC